MELHTSPQGLPPTGYTPHAKQLLLHQCPATEILFGGAAGPGKSHALRHEALDWCLHVPGIQVYLFRRTFPELEQSHILKSLAEFPQAYGTYREQKKRWEFRHWNDASVSMLHFCHAQHENDVFQYQSAEFHVLIIDELTSFTEFMYDYLRGRVRCAMPVPERYQHLLPRIICGTNPGGVGHQWVKSRWIDPAPPGTMWQTPKDQGGMVRVYIPGLLEDNPTLTENDPGYVDRLDGLPEPWRTAYKKGDWNLFVGQAFYLDRQHHIVSPQPVPREAPVYMTFDWGYGAPFSIGWWWVDVDGRIYRFAEWYGASGPNQGLRLEDSRIAEGIKERERELGLDNRVVLRLAGPDCWNRKPDYKGGGQGPATAEVFAQHGIYMTPGDADRALKIRQFRERLRTYTDIPPMLRVYDTCREFIRTIPSLQFDAKNVEDVDTTGEDHQYDEACHICMARPMKLAERMPVASWQTARIDAMLRGERGDDQQTLTQDAWASEFAALDEFYQEQRGYGIYSGPVKRTVD